MAFHSKKELEIRFNGILIDEVSSQSQKKSVKLLGIEIDPNLNWSEHINRLSSKIRSYLYGLRRIRYEVDEHVRLAYFRAYIMSSMQYGIEIWGSSPKFHALEKLQKQGVRLLKAKKNVVHTSDLFKSFNILPLFLLLEQRERCLGYKYNDLDLFEKSSSQRQKDRHQVRLPLQIDIKQVFWRVSNTWNSMPVSLKEETSTKT